MEVSAVTRDVLGYLGGALLGVCLLPELVHVWRSKSAAGISLSWTLLYLVGVAPSMAYLILMDAVAGWVSLIVEALMIVILIIFKLTFSPPPQLQRLARLMSCRPTIQTSRATSCSGTSDTSGDAHVIVELWDIKHSKATTTATPQLLNATCWLPCEDGSGGCSPDSTTSRMQARAARCDTHADPVAVAEAALCASSPSLGPPPDAIMVVNLGRTKQLMEAWRHHLPRVRPFYAVKCLPDIELCRTLAAMGAGFDCASTKEIDIVASLPGVSPTNDIIFAHPVKPVSHVLRAAAMGVELVTFDCVGELAKIRDHAPQLKCVLRLKVDTCAGALSDLNAKYGADLDQCTYLLKTAADMGIKVVGVAFHVGSGCKHAAAYGHAIRAAASVFSACAALGLPPLTLLDLGGGFNPVMEEGEAGSFMEAARVIRDALQEHFGQRMQKNADAPPLTIIAEPGRFFAQDSATMLLSVLGTRGPAHAHIDQPYESMPIIAHEPPTAAVAARATFFPDLPCPLIHHGLPTDRVVEQEVFIADGMYGMFLCTLFGYVYSSVGVMRSPLLPPLATTPSPPLLRSRVWGPTCDSADLICEAIDLPQLRVGDWLVFGNAGAYSVAGSSGFNGFGAAAECRLYHG